MPAKNVYEFGKSNSVFPQDEETYGKYKERLRKAIRDTGTVGVGIAKASLSSLERMGEKSDIAVRLAQAALDGNMPQPPDPVSLPPEIDSKGVRVPWLQRAACKNADPDLFINDYDTSSGAGREIANIAKTYCAVCPVRDTCLETADSYNLRKQGRGRGPQGDDGVWGGMTKPERDRRLRKLRSRK